SCGALRLGRALRAVHHRLFDRRHESARFGRELGRARFGDGAIGVLDEIRGGEHGDEARQWHGSISLQRLEKFRGRERSIGTRNAPREIFAQHIDVQRHVPSTLARREQPELLDARKAVARESERTAAWFRVRAASCDAHYPPREQREQNSAPQNPRPDQWWREKNRAPV